MAAADEWGVQVCLVKDVEREQTLQTRVVVTNQAVNLRRKGGSRECSAAPRDNQRLVLGSHQSAHTASATPVCVRVPPTHHDIMLTTHTAWRQWHLVTSPLPNT